MKLGTQLYTLINLEWLLRTVRATAWNLNNLCLLCLDPWGFEFCVTNELQKHRSDTYTVLSPLISLCSCHSKIKTCSNWHCVYKKSSDLYIQINTCTTPWVRLQKDIPPPDSTLYLPLLNYFPWNSGDLDYPPSCTFSGGILQLCLSLISILRFIAKEELRLQEIWTDGWTGW